MMNDSDAVSHSGVLWRLGTPSFPVFRWKAFLALGVALTRLAVGLEPPSVPGTACAVSPDLLAQIIWVPR